MLCADASSTADPGARGHWPTCAGDMSSEPMRNVQVSSWPLSTSVWGAGNSMMCCFGWLRAVAQAVVTQGRVLCAGLEEHAD